MAKRKDPLAPLKREQRWVNWRYEDHGRDKPVKVPYQSCAPDRRAKSNDPKTWSSYQQAKRTHKQVPSLSGIGVMLGDGWAGIDLDKCRDSESGEIETWARAIIDEAGCYAEVSPSGTGVKLFGRYLGQPSAGVNRPYETGKVEVYNDVRYFTVTENALPGTGLVGVDITEVVDRWMERLRSMGSKSKQPGPATRRKVGRSAGLSDAQIIAAIRSGKHQALWVGELDPDRYGSPSEGDLALCSVIAYHVGDEPERIDRIFRESGLMRSKWEDREDYRESTIDLALTGYTSAGLNDIGNAERLVARFGDEICFNHLTRTWYVWNGRFWEPDTTGHMDRLAKHTAYGIFAEAQRIDSDDRGNSERADKVRSWANASCSAARLRDMVKLAESEVTVRLDCLDSDEWLLNVANGTLDLRTGELRSHRREDHITRMIDVEYDPDAKCPRWQRFLREILNGNTSLMQFIQQWFGHCLTGDVSEQYLMMFHGEGGNGKSVLVDTLRAIMGEYAGEAAPDLLEHTYGNRHPTEIIDLRGKRLVTTSEAERQARLRVQLVKRLTGDRVLKGRGMRQDFVEFKRTHKLVMLTNNRPKIEEDTEGIWRRVRIVPFKVIIPPERRDPHLIDALLKEKAGILAWLVEGCRSWQTGGRLVIPQVVIDETETYRREENLVADFIEERLRVGEYSTADPIEKRYCVRVTDVYDHYKLFCEEHGERPLGAKALSQDLQRRLNGKLRKHAVRFEKGKGARPEKAWCGIRLKHGA